MKRKKRGGTASQKFVRLQKRAMEKNETKYCILFIAPYWPTAQQGEREIKQSQKHYMVSGSLCPLISFLNISYLVSFVVRGQRPRRGR